MEDKYTMTFFTRKPLFIMCPHTYVRVRTYSTAWKMRGVHMRTYAYVRIRPRGKCVESTYVRIRTYSTAWSPSGCPRRNPTISDVPRGVHALRDLPPYVRCKLLTSNIKRQLNVFNFGNLSSNVIQHVI